MGTLFDYEKKHGVIIHAVVDPSEELSDQDIEGLKTTHGYHEFDFKAREKWLGINGYEKTRDNFTNSSLLSQEEVAAANDAQAETEHQE